MGTGRPYGNARRCRGAPDSAEELPGGMKVRPVPNRKVAEGRDRRGWGHLPLASERTVPLGNGEPYPKCVFKHNLVRF